MAEIRHLSNAPIREAVIDIQFQPAASIEAVDRFAADFARSDDKVSDLWTATLQVNSQTNGASQVGTRIGKRIVIDEGVHIVQFRTTGFTFSRLPPYDRWEVMSADALRIWERYFAVVKPASLTRLATRFINAIDLPLPVMDFGDFLTYPPEVPDGLPQVIADYLHRVSFCAPGATDITTITQALEGLTADQKCVCVLLDIDAAHTPSPQVLDIGQVALILDRLRDTKNKAFYGSLKEKALEPYL
ncbi:TIGR04255 family protein [Burkholderia gladioli]|uniref:TIGR04255 family protein n=1 Tax=Burkholderia gladioli TaxID=28095 RepID=UPI003F7B1BB1